MIQYSNFYTKVANIQKYTVIYKINKNIQNIQNLQKYTKYTKYTKIYSNFYTKVANIDAKTLYTSFNRGLWKDSETKILCNPCILDTVGIF